MAADQSQLEAAVERGRRPRAGPDPRRARPGALGAAAPAPGPDRGRPARGGLARHRRAGRRDPPGRRLGAGRRGGRARVRRDDRRGAGRAAPAPAGRHARRTAPSRTTATTTGTATATAATGTRTAAPMPAFLAPGRQDPGHRGVVGQGRRRQVDGDGEPRHRAGPGRAPGRAARRRRLRLLGPQDARHRPRPGDPRRHRDPDLGPRRACLSMGYFVPDDQPVIWRGPMLHKAIQQFLTDAYWGEPDFVLVDMPPGTGDVALTLAEVMPRAEIVVVTTPQAGGAAGGPALGLRGAPAQALRARRGREHELVHRRRRHALRAVRRGRGRDAGRRPRRAAARPGARWSTPSASAATRGVRSWRSIRRARRRRPSGPSPRSWPPSGPARVYRRELTLR